MIGRPCVPPLLLAAALLAPATAPGQEPQLPPTNQEIFAPLELPTASELRTAAGAPGNDYWQQRSDYRIEVSLDPARHSVTGSETIHYTNNSPDALDELWLQLDQNLFAPGSRGSIINAGNRWRGSFAEGGFRIGRVELAAPNRSPLPADYAISDTRMRIGLATPLAAQGGSIDIEIDWSFVIPEYGADRMGRLETAAGWVYEIAQWYPRMYVYDDVAGWNPMPYLGQGEFYLDYGSFDVAITAPRGFVVVATGALQNEGEVLTREQQRRLARARTSEETVAIIAAGEVGSRDAVPSGTGPLTWRFRAENVRDFTWAASRAFIWDAADAGGVLVMSAYPQEGVGDADNPGWEMATQYARHTITHYSERWFQYPLPVAVNVAGVVGGMEYPGIVFCSVNARAQGLFGVTDHEFGHNWFPMVVGSDERRYAWMDEGFNTFINHYSNQAYWGPNTRRLVRTSGDFIAGRMQEPIADQPIMTYPDMLRRDGLGFMGYRKPGYGLIMLREVILGPERFDAAFRAYIAEWAFRHPKPADFFRTIEARSGEDLSWFWRGWFYSTDRLDQAVDSVSTDSAGTIVHLSNARGLVMPVDVEIEFTDGAAARRRLPVEIWIQGDTFDMAVDDPRPVRSVTIDPDHWMPDIDRANNTWSAGPPIS